MNFDSAMLHDDEQARDEALDVTRSFIVQAPAGSGKTELLIQRYLRLLAIVDNPEEVLAITFTRKAAAEMQLRVLKALQQAKCGDDPIEAHEQITSAAARIVLEKDAEFGWDLIANPRRMRIQTLDSLNASIARLQPLTSTGGASGNKILADAEMGMLYRVAATLTLDQLAETGPLNFATALVLDHLDNSTWLYVRYLATMLQSRDQWLPFIGSGLGSDEEILALRQRFESTLRQIVTGHLQQVRDAIPVVAVTPLLGLATYAALELSAAGHEQNPMKSLLDIGELPGPEPDSIPQWLCIADFFLTREGGWRKTVNKNQGFPPGDDGQKAAMLELLGSMRENEECRALLNDIRKLPPASYSHEQWRILLALFQLLPLAVTELKRLFSERGVTDYIEVALCAGDALGTAESPGDITLLLDYQLRHLLVDEMQDTSSAQYRMLEALTGGWQEGDGRTLFCVGDPMQSIYRFRNAEVGQFLLARSCGIAAVKLNSLVLRRNFRSGERLVNWFNEVFPGILPMRDDPTKSAVSYSAAIPVPKLAGQGICTVHPLFGSSKSQEADAGCRVIQQTLEAFPDDDMVVLVRGRTQLPQLLSRLRKAGIAYRSVEIDRLTDLPEIIDVLALTRTLVHFGDRLAWLALLRAPWIGLHWTDLHALVMNDSRRTVWELLHDPDRLKRLSSTGQELAREAVSVLSPLMTAGRAESLRDRVERAWLALGGPAVLIDENAISNVYHYLDVVEKIEVTGSIPDVAELESILDEERVSSDSNARLQVMTMHRAKGLQFDHVLLYGLGRVPGNNERKVLSWFDIPDEHGGTAKIVSPVGARAEIENDPLHRYIELIESGKDKFEQGRLLYVACTRARKSLQLMGHVELNKDATEFRPANSRSLMNLLWPSVASDYESAFDLRADLAEAGEVDNWVDPVLRRLQRPWSLPAGLPVPGRSASIDLSSDDDARNVEFYWVGSAARMAGTVVHRWLQMATDGQVQLRVDDVATLRPVSVRWLQEMGIGETAAATVCDRVETALHGMLDDDKGRWILEGQGHAELRLSGLVSGVVESVILDRVRIDEDGTHWIIDYKTSTHEGGNLDDFLEAELERYAPQLSRYATFYRDYAGVDARCALYFPLLQRFVEIPA